MLKLTLHYFGSGVVSTELGPSLETQRHRGRQDHMDKPLLFSIALMNLTLSGSFLILTETHLCLENPMDGGAWYVLQRAASCQGIRSMVGRPDDHTGRATVRPA